MTRSRLFVTIAGRRGPIDRAFEALREMGYTVGDTLAVGKSSVTAELHAPYGEVDSRPRFLGKPKRRRS